MYVFKNLTNTDYKHDKDDVNNGDGDVRTVKLLAVLTNDSDNSRNSDICFTKADILFSPA